MGDSPHQKAWEEITNGIGKVFVWSFYVIAGVLAKLAFDSRSNPLSKRQMIVKTIISIFVGFIAATWCESYGYQKMGKIIVPVATVIGEGFMVYMMANYRKLAAKLLPEWLQNIFK